MLSIRSAPPPQSHYETPDRDFLLLRFGVSLGFDRWGCELGFWHKLIPCAITCMDAYTAACWAVLDRTSKITTVSHCTIARKSSHDSRPFLFFRGSNKPLQLHTLHTHIHTDPFSPTNPTDRTDKTRERKEEKKKKHKRKKGMVMGFASSSTHSKSKVSQKTSQK